VVAAAICLELYGRGARPLCFSVYLLGGEAEFSPGTLNFAVRICLWVVSFLPETFALATIILHRQAFYYLHLSKIRPASEHPTTPMKDHTSNFPLS
jgi:hypothetical protein